MEIVARRLGAMLPGERIESVLAPGINAVKTFDPPLHDLAGAAFTDVRRRGHPPASGPDAPKPGTRTPHPPRRARPGAASPAGRRRGKLLLFGLESDKHGSLTLLVHLMSAGRM